jgi:hypothetical protein
VELLQLKTQILKKVIDKGINFFFSDADAFWVKNIYQLMKNFPYDISMSVSHYTPQDVAKKWGFILNTGLYLVRSNKSSKVFVEEFMNFSLKNSFSTEQANLNRFLLQNKTQWKRNSKVENEGYNMRFKIKIKAISNNIISREPKSGIYVYHPFLEGGMEKKLSFAKDKLVLFKSENNAMSC